jgi:hypothetical protein
MTPIVSEQRSLPHLRKQQRGHRRCSLTPPTPETPKLLYCLGLLGYSHCLPTLDKCKPYLVPHFIEADMSVRQLVGILPQRRF